MERDDLAWPLADLPVGAVLEGAPVGLALFDRGLRAVRANAEMAGIAGLPVADQIGRSLEAVLPGFAASLRPALDRAFAGDTNDLELSQLAGPANARSWRVSLRPLRDQAGRISFVGAWWIETTGAKRTEAALRESETRFRSIVTGAQEGIWAVDRTGVTTLVNPRLAEMLGVDPAAMLGRPVDEFCFDHDIAEAREHIADNLAGRGKQFEFRLRRVDGASLDVLAATAPLRDGEGRIVGALGGFVDLSPQKRAEARTRVLIDELAHRGRNLLAVIQSIASLTLAVNRPLGEARQVLTGRLQALANTYSRLTEGGVEGAPLAEIVAAETASFGERVRVAGPHVILNAKAAQTVALVVHELATNAGKYGALSVPAGMLHVAWRSQTDESGRRLRFEWVETGGPPARPPVRHGFGSRLLVDVARAELRAEPKMEFATTGLRYVLDAPLAALGTELDQSAVRQNLRATPLARLFDSWAALRGPDGALPLWKTFRRERLSAGDPLTVAEIGERGEVRLIEVAPVLRDRLGTPAAAASMAAEGPDSLVAAYRRCAGRGAPCHEFVRFGLGDDAGCSFERLLVPFGGGGNRVTHVAGMVVFEGETHRPAVTHRGPP